jgi:hypothetical protein
MTSQVVKPCVTTAADVTGEGIRLSLFRHRQAFRGGNGKVVLLPSMVRGHLAVGQDRIIHDASNQNRDVGGGIRQEGRGMGWARDRQSLMWRALAPSRHAPCKLPFRKVPVREEAGKGNAGVHIR